MELSTPEPWLPVVRTCSRPSAPGAHESALVLGAAGLLADRLLAARLQKRRLGHGRAHQPQQGRAHERQERDHHRDRITRQAEEDCRTHATHCHRPARPHGDLPERHVTQLLHHGLGEVGLADADAAAGDDRVASLRGLTECGFQQLGIVAHHAQIHDVAAQALQQIRTRCIGCCRKPRLRVARLRRSKSRRPWKSTQRVAAAPQAPCRCPGSRSSHRLPGRAVVLRARPARRHAGLRRTGAGCRRA